MKYVDPCDRTVLFGTGGLQAPIIYVIDLPLPEYAQTVLSWIGLMGSGCSVTVGGGHRRDS